MHKFTMSKGEWAVFQALFERVRAARGLKVDNFENKLENLRSAIENHTPKFLELNEKINLSAIRDPQGVLWKHFYDSFLLLLLPIRGVIVDWGTGGGFPAVPLLFWRFYVEGSREEIIFLDGRGKKLNAIRELLPKEVLEQARFEHGRGEEFVRSEHVDAVVMRAVAPPDTIVAWLSKGVHDWFFFAGPEQTKAWDQLSSKISKKGLMLKHKIDETLPFQLGQRTILQFSASK